MRRRYRTFLGLLFAATAGVALGVGWWLFAPHVRQTTSVTVQPGESFFLVVMELNEREVVRDPWLFSKLSVLAGLDRRVIPGRYDFSAHLSHFDVMRKLWRGDVTFVGVTIPEGFTLRQISRLLYEQCGIDPAVFDSLVRDSQYLTRLGVMTGFAEGYLFPETYNFHWGVTADEVIRTIVHELFSRLNDTTLARADSLGLTLHQLLALASIVQSEATADDEYPLIASVYHNRYRTGMRLQADPTVIYGMGGLDRGLLFSDYQFPSRYNTYLHQGLPPTPICSPGMKAIMATLYPDSTDYFFFVADGNGRHLFNQTYEQHLHDIQRIKSESQTQEN